MGCINNKEIYEEVIKLQKNQIVLVEITKQIASNYNQVSNNFNDMKSVNNEILSLIHLTVSPRKKEN